MNMDTNKSSVLWFELKVFLTERGQNVRFKGIRPNKELMQKTKKVHQDTQFDKLLFLKMLSESQNLSLRIEFPLNFI